MNNPIGLIEIRGLVGAIEATVAMVKCENVKLIRREKIGGGLVTIIVEGDLGAVKTTIDTGMSAEKRVGELISAHIIARPHSELNKIISLNKK